MIEFEWGNDVFVDNIHLNSTVLNSQLSKDILTEKQSIEYELSFNTATAKGNWSSIRQFPTKS
jgi:hypothetical protein